ncbi:putative methyltransferase [Histomonas meleagridis]|uniref:putative methyltransferase n=1 Tax=Histomonas meleagridis TaxID=135588 RepID=UPI00355989F7|nr:putative methyltransferase [Histomonas meleagridis]KAH0806764.1 putative methyltransferase [Histomonas meleagridis]
MNLVLGTQQNVQQNKETEDEILDKELENILNHPAPNYFEPSYWNTRYEEEPEPFEWYQTWDSLKGALLPQLKTKGKILEIGCGNSSVSFSLAQEGFERVVGIDVSNIVIEQNKQRYTGQDNLSFECCDCLEMKNFENETFDYVFDKGTMDSLICSNKSNELISKLLSEVSRVLKPGGTYIVISYGTPNTRNVYFKGQNRLKISDTIEIEKPTEKGTFHYMYIIQKD